MGYRIILPWDMRGCVHISRQEAEERTITASRYSAFISDTELRKGVVFDVRRLIAVQPAHLRPYLQHVAQVNSPDSTPLRNAAGAGNLVKGPLYPLQNNRRALAAADTHGGEAVPRALTL
jgi:hypothetical protein